ncbi:MAG: hypothetical protein ACI4XA_00225 [Oscillospiraceae bacterium]
MLESGKAYVKITHEVKGHNIPDDIKTYSESKAKIIPESAKTHSEDKVKIVPPPGKAHPAEEPAQRTAPEKEAVTTDDPAAGEVSLNAEAAKIVPPVAKRECKKYS